MATSTQQEVVLYELRDPIEHKYGGTLTREEAARCVRTTNLDSTWKPYPHKKAAVENICGKFAKDQGPNLAPGPPLGSDPNCVSPHLKSVCFKNTTPFGRQTEIFHLKGHVSITCAPGLVNSVSFKGVRGYAAMRTLAKDLLLPEDTTLGLVHMGVFGSNLGVRIQTSPGCYLENRVVHVLHWMGIEVRPIDHCNAVRLTVRDWSGTGLPEMFWPLENDILITGKGSVMHRFSWHKLVWTSEAEAQVLEACEAVSEAIRNICA
jgi:hypothetical protein